MLMVAAAMLLHGFIVFIYSLSPHEMPLIIPVRALNIKLDSGAAGLDMPKPESMPGYQPPPPPVVEPEKPVIQVREAPKPNPPAPPKAPPRAQAKDAKPLISIISQTGEKQPHPARNHALLQPKKYVRENDVAMFSKNGKGTGNGTTMKGTKEGQEIIANYGQEISLWLTQHKVYPEDAKRQMLQGTVVVHIRIDRQGRILYSGISSSSGSALIDQAAMAMVHASDPVPAVPANYPKDSELAFEIPVSFTLQ
ncbi:MAG TPA: TonB family protein [Rickettsiales bacterium]|nr:TonB family protein [Rickettsiales bacterium]